MIGVDRGGVEIGAIAAWILESMAVMKPPAGTDCSIHDWKAATDGVTVAEDAGLAVVPGFAVRGAGGTLVTLLDSI